MAGHSGRPAVSEREEGRPWFEWTVAVLVVVSAGLALLRLVTAATGLLAAVSIICATVRLVLRTRSPWKIRGVVFDCLIGYAFGLGLIGTYISILLIT